MHSFRDAELRIVGRHLKVFDHAPHKIDFQRLLSYGWSRTLPDNLESVTY
jgi:hypothetical protein